MAFERAFLDELRSRIDLVDLIGSRLPLRRSGKEFVAYCPFHEERTPSFYVSPTKQFYHCFGCGASGDAIAFLMNYDRLSFREAVATLARRCGLELPGEETSPEAERRRRLTGELLQLNREVARLYFRKLRDREGEAARAYLRVRGIGGEIARRFGLGYAPRGPKFLLDRFDPERLRSAGLIVEREGRACDRFRHRLIFPIRDITGRVLGFGGRVLGEGSPKYLNSPETPLFQKRRCLYGLYELLQAGRPRSLLVVEGYFDLLALVQAGMAHVVATLGTALSEEQLRLLFRYADEVTLCFDGDPAGLRAAWRALETALPHLQDGRTLRFLLLPTGHDPDAFIRKEGTAAFRRRLEEALPLSDFLFRYLSRDLPLETPEGRAKLAARARPYLKRLPKGALRDLLWRKLRALLRGEERLEPIAPPPARPSLLRWLIALTVRFPSLASRVGEGPEPLKMAVQLQKEGLTGEALSSRLTALYPELGDLHLEMEALPEEEALAEQILRETLSKWRLNGRLREKRRPIGKGGDGNGGSVEKVSG